MGGSGRGTIYGIHEYTFPDRSWFLHDHTNHRVSAFEEMARARPAAAIA